MSRILNVLPLVAPTTFYGVPAFWNFFHSEYQTSVGPFLTKKMQLPVSDVKGV
jgi:hypothetical protein